MRLSRELSGANESATFALLSSLALAAVLAFPLYCDGLNSFVIFGDEADSNLPQLMHLKNMLMKQEFSFWWYNSVSGTDYMGSAVVIKTNLLMFLLLPNYVAYLLCRYLAYAIGIYSTYVLMRGYFNVGSVGSLLAGFLFMGQLMYAPLLGHGWSMSLLPLVLYYFLKVDKLSINTLLLSGLYGLLYGFTGNFTQTFYMLYFIFLFCLVFRFGEMRLWLISFAVFSIMHIISQVPDMMSAFSVAGISHRSEDLYLTIRESVLLPEAVHTDRANLMTYIANLKSILLSPSGVMRQHLFLTPLLIGIFLINGRLRLVLVKLLLVYLAILYADAFTLNMLQTVFKYCVGSDGAHSKLIASGIDTRLWMMKPLIQPVMMLVSINYVTNHLGRIASDGERLSN